ncbi:flagellar hook protein [Sphingomonas sp. Leaf357]|uniref:flagellar filament capping protein FliD n=1 Tax=Sphingomonas sp. Leaf357 TaxID=1736350 RepID=UPI0006FEE13A|nr:flagellar filament capping protein FliD [Sphingomonas sp. Leaf357]KQS03388.1 flagellar hook protein [Sphingomonas sp. Leaf357]
MTTTSSITTALGAGSGVDINALVASLVDAQFANKTTQLTNQSATITKQISAVSTLKSGITSFASALNSLVKGGSLATAPTSSNSSILNVSALSGAKLSGLSASVEVRQLAAAQVATSTPRADPIASVGKGSFTLTFGTATVGDGAMTGFTAGSGTPVTIPITTGNSGLNGIARAINAAGAGVTATVLTDSAGSRLSIKGATGEAQAFTLTATEDPAAPGLAALNIGPDATATTIGSAARDAIVAVDGTALKRSTNSVSDLITGVKLDLVSASVGTTVTIGTSAPTSALSQAVNDFVETFNQLNTAIKEQTDPATGALRSDAAATGLQRQMRQLTLTKLTTGAAAGAPTTLAEIGVKTNRDGSLSVDSNLLSTMLTKYPQAVEAMFADGKGASGNGLSGALTSISDAAVSIKTGLGASATRYSKAQSDLASDQSDLSDAETKATTRLTAQFAAMDARVAAYKSTQAFLTQQIDAWNSKA